MTPSTQIHIGCTLVGEGAVLLQDAFDREGFVHPDSFSNGDLERTEKKLRAAADKIAQLRAGLLANTPEDMRPVNQVARLVAAE